MLRLAAASLAAVAALAGGKPARALVVPTDRGPVLGTTAFGMHEWLGIPYAAPPVGALRWQPPQLHARWTGVRPATSFGAVCPQPAGPFGDAGTNESCLYLNVFAPGDATPSSRLPVMFWIHGGALISGESNDYIPTALVSRGGVVVTINYRLGLLGFLAHPALGSDSGDYGLMDQQFALQWVHRNIAHFGGDPADVTIFGESAGGLSVRSQLISPAARGLFQHAIIESGAYTQTVPTQAQAEAEGTATAAALGCADQTAACLRALPVSKLLTGETAISQLPNISSVLPEQFGAAFATGDFAHVPVLTGSNHDEWMLFVDLLNSQLNNPVTTANYPSMVAATLGLPSASAAAPVVALYPASAYATPYNALGAVGTDAIFACNALADAANMSKYTPTYQYEFNDESAPLIFTLAPVPYSLGAYHASELQFIFPTTVSALTPQETQLATAMQTAWTSFAKTGNPGWSAFPQAESLVPPAPAPETTFAAEHNCAFWAAAGG